MERQKRLVRINPAQLLFMMQKPKSATSIWGRGTGKSYILAWLIHIIVKYMPRSTWTIGGRTFTQMLEITLLPTFYALENFGYIKDIHYVVCRRPQEKMKFERPLKPTVKYDYAITFFNGTTFQLLSQDRNSRGGDVQGGIWDESLIIDWKKYDEHFVPTLRGFKDEFGHIPFYRGIFHFSSMPDSKEGKRLLEKGHYYLDHGIDLDVQMKKLIKMQLAFIDSNDNAFRRELWPEIQQLRDNIKFFKDSNGHLYSEANAFDNLQNLGFEYLLDLRRNMMDLTFRIEVLNEKLPAILNGFYCNLDEDYHLYDAWDYSHIDNLGFDRNKLKDKDCRFDNDLDKHKALHLGIDPGTHINVAAVAQYHHTEIRFLKDFHVKAPGLLKHLVKQFCDYYRYHEKKLVKVSYDTGSSSQQQYETSKSLIAQVREDLIREGWTVEILSKGRKLTHHQRYDLVNDMYLQSALAPDNRKYPVLAYNRYNCHDLVTALANVEIKQSGNEYKKDKAGEKDSSHDQLKEPHLTDAHDYIIDDLLKDIYKKKSLAGLGEFYT